MASEKYIVYEIKILFLVLIGLPLIATTNIDCSGKSFHCLNSTHFMICVDLGGGISMTADDYVIPCPPTTQCKGTNRFECEFPISTTTTTTEITIAQTAAVTKDIESKDIVDVIVDNIYSSNTSQEQHLELSTVTVTSTDSTVILPNTILSNNETGAIANATEIEDTANGLLDIMVNNSTQSTTGLNFKSAVVSNTTESGTVISYEILKTSTVSSQNFTDSGIYYETEKTDPVILLNTDNNVESTTLILDTPVTALDQGMAVKEIPISPSHVMENSTIARRTLDTVMTTGPILKLPSNAMENNTIASTLDTVTTTGPILNSESATFSITMNKSLSAPIADSVFESITVPVSEYFMNSTDLPLSTTTKAPFAIYGTTHTDKNSTAPTTQFVINSTDMPLAISTSTTTGAAFNAPTIGARTYTQIAPKSNDTLDLLSTESSIDSVTVSTTEVLTTMNTPVVSRATVTSNVNVTGTFIKTNETLKNNSMSSVTDPVTDMFTTITNKPLGIINITHSIDSVAVPVPVTFSPTTDTTIQITNTVGGSNITVSGIDNIFAKSTETNNDALNISNRNGSALSELSTEQTTNTNQPYTTTSIEKIDTNLKNKTKLIHQSGLYVNDIMQQENIITTTASSIQITKVPPKTIIPKGLRSIHTQESTISDKIVYSTTFDTTTESNIVTTANIQSLTTRAIAAVEISLNESNAGNVSSYETTNTILTKNAVFSVEETKTTVVPKFNTGQRNQSVSNIQDSGTSILEVAIVNNSVLTQFPDILSTAQSDDTDGLNVNKTEVTNTLEGGVNNSQPTPEVKNINFNGSTEIPRTKINDSENMTESTMSGTILPTSEKKYNSITGVGASQLTGNEVKPVNSNNDSLVTELIKYNTNISNETKSENQKNTTTRLSIILDTKKIITSNNLTNNSLVFTDEQNEPTEPGRNILQTEKNVEKSSTAAVEFMNSEPTTYLSNEKQDIHMTSTEYYNIAAISTTLYLESSSNQQLVMKQTTPNDVSQVNVMVPELVATTKNIVSDGKPLITEAYASETIASTTTPSIDGNTINQLVLESKISNDSSQVSVTASELVTTSPRTETKPVVAPLITEGYAQETIALTTPAFDEPTIHQLVLESKISNDSSQVSVTASELETTTSALTTTATASYITTLQQLVLNPTIPNDSSQVNDTTQELMTTTAWAETKPIVTPFNTEAYASETFDSTSTFTDDETSLVDIKNISGLHTKRNTSSVINESKINMELDEILTTVSLISMVNESTNAINQVERPEKESLSVKNNTKNVVEKENTHDIPNYSLDIVAEDSQTLIASSTSIYTKAADYKANIESSSNNALNFTETSTKENVTNEIFKTNTEIRINESTMGPSLPTEALLIAHYAAQERTKLKDVFYSSTTEKYDIGTTRLNSLENFTNVPLIKDQLTPFSQQTTAETFTDAFTEEVNILRNLASNETAAMNQAINISLNDSNDKHILTVTKSKQDSTAEMPVNIVNTFGNVDLQTNVTATNTTQSIIMNTTEQVKYFGKSDINASFEPDYFLEFTVAVTEQVRPIPREEELSEQTKLNNAKHSIQIIMPNTTNQSKGSYVEPHNATNDMQNISLNTNQQMYAELGNGKSNNSSAAINIIRNVFEYMQTPLSVPRNTARKTIPIVPKETNQNISLSKRNTSTAVLSVIKETGTGPSIETNATFNNLQRAAKQISALSNKQLSNNTDAIHSILVILTDQFSTFPVTEAKNDTNTRETVLLNATEQIKTLLTYKQSNTSNTYQNDTQGESKQIGTLSATEKNKITDTIYTILLNATGRIIPLQSEIHSISTNAENTILQNRSKQHAKVKFAEQGKVIDIIYNILLSTTQNETSLPKTNNTKTIETILLNATEQIKTLLTSGQSNATNAYQNTLQNESKQTEALSTPKQNNVTDIFYKILLNKTDQIGSLPSVEQRNSINDNDNNNTRAECGNVTDTIRNVLLCATKNITSLPYSDQRNITSGIQIINGTVTLSQENNMSTKFVEIIKSSNSENNGIDTPTPATLLKDQLVDNYESQRETPKTNLLTFENNVFDSKQSKDIFKIENVEADGVTNQSPDEPKFYSQSNVPSMATMSEVSLTTANILVENENIRTLKSFIPEKNTELRYVNHLKTESKLLFENTSPLPILLSTTVNKNSVDIYESQSVDKLNKVVTPEKSLKIHNSKVYLDKDNINSNTAIKDTPKGSNNVETEKIRVNTMIVLSNDSPNVFKQDEKIIQNQNVNKNTLSEILSDHSILSQIYSDVTSTINISVNIEPTTNMANGPVIEVTTIPFIPKVTYGVHTLSSVDMMTAVSTEMSSTVHPATVSPVKGELAGPQFDCQNRPTGRYADSDDCSRFYICSGTSVTIVGKCPANTVFSDIRKQCTRNLSHCIRNNEFKCTSIGRFADYLKPNVYYICIKNQNTFVRYKLQCQSGFLLNRLSVRCYKDSQLSSQSISVDNSQSTTKNKSQEKVKVSKTKKNKTKKEFKCEEEGKFADPYSCRGYYVCKLKNKSDETYTYKYKKCDSDEVFHKDKKKCVDAGSYECRYCDKMDHNIYFIHMQRGKHFLTFKLRCQKGFYLNTTSVRCNNISNRPTTKNESSKTNPARPESKTNASWRSKDFSHNKNKETFQCKEEGKFVDPIDSTKFYICKDRNRSASEKRFIRKHKKCSKREVFNEKELRCQHYSNKS